MPVAVIPAGAGGARRERVAATIMGRHVRCSFFMSAIDFGRDMESVPVNHLAFAGIVPNVDDHRLAFGRAQERPRHLAVVPQRLDGPPGRKVESDFANVKGDIGVGLSRKARRLTRARFR